MVQTVDSYKELIETARAAFQNSYAPYSKYRVGAALLTKDGRIFSGANVEIVTWDGSVCAERVAMASAVAQGYREFRAIAVVGEQGPETWPCGVCRQFLAEFGHGLTVVVPTADGSIKTLSLKDLLPFVHAPETVLGINSR